MGWTDPRDWTAGELVTAPMMNEQIRDNLDYLYARATGASSGFPAFMGGVEGVSTTAGTAFASGATMAALVPSTRVHRVAHPTNTFTGRTWKIGAMLRLSATGGGAAATLALFNLTAAPDTALTNSTITSVSTVGEWVQCASGITLPTGTSPVDFGVKLHSAHASTVAEAWSIVWFPTD